MIVAIGICAALLIGFMALFDKKEHVIWMLLCSFFVLYLMLLIPKAIIDNPDTCEIVKMNETVVGNTTTYQYDQVCETYTRKTHTIFYQIMLWLIRLFVTYIFIYFNYVVWIKSRLIKMGIIKTSKERKP